MPSQIDSKPAVQTLEPRSASTIQTLDQCAPGQRVSLHSIVGGKRLRERLLSMGLPIGGELQVLRNRSGAVVVGRGANRLAIGRGMAEKIMVSL